MAMVGIIFMSFINDCVLYLVSCSFWILKTKIPWMYIRGQDKLDEKSATKIHMYVHTKKRYVFLKWKVLATYIVGHWAHVRPTFISTQTETVSLLSLIHNGVKYFLEEHSDFHGPMFTCDFFYYFHTVYKRSSKNKSCENTAAGK